MSERKIVELIQRAEDLKCDLWALIEDAQRNGSTMDCKGVKDAMNELLDLLDSMADERVWP